MTSFPPAAQRADTDLTQFGKTPKSKHPASQQALPPAPGSAKPEDAPQNPHLNTPAGFQGVQAHSSTAPGTRRKLRRGKLSSSNSSNQHCHFPNLWHHSELGEWGQTQNFVRMRRKLRAQQWLGLWLGLLAAPAAHTAVWGRNPDLC